MPNIQLKNPATGESATFSHTADVHNAIKVYGWVPVHSDGSPYVVQEFMGGYLLDGAPLNVYIEGQWYDGQKQALQPEWTSGRVPTPSTAVLNVGVVPMPPEVEANNQLYQAATNNKILGMEPLTALGVGFLAYRFLKK